MKSLIISFLSISIRLIYGLLLYPYQTIWQITEHKPFSPLLLTPIAVFGVLKVIWYLVVFSIFGQVEGIIIDLLANFIVFFCIYWQGLIFYLTFRFWYAKHR